VGSGSPAQDGMHQAGGPCWGGVVRPMWLCWVHGAALAGWACRDRPQCSGNSPVQPGFLVGCRMLAAIQPPCRPTAAFFFPAATAAVTGFVCIGQVPGVLPASHLLVACSTHEGVDRNARMQADPSSLPVCHASPSATVLTAGCAGMSATAAPAAPVCSSVLDPPGGKFTLCMFPHTCNAGYAGSLRYQHWKQPGQTGAS
jgi:hypothetical protein